MNNNLLRRSEVVALINTLYRFTESLEGIKQFRRMWAEIGPSESAQLLRDSQEVVSVGNSMSRRVQILIARRHRRVH